MKTAKGKKKREKINKESVIMEMMPFIKYTAYRYQWKLPPQMTVDDLISSGIIGLLDAIEKFDPSKNVKIKTYAEFRIKGAMLDEIRANDWAPKTLRKRMNDIKAAYAEIESIEGRRATEEEVADRLGMTLEELFDTLNQSNSAVMVSIEEMSEMRSSSSGEESDIYEYLTDPGAQTPLDVAEKNDRVAQLAGMINELEEKERLVITLYYYEEMTFKEIGIILNLTESRICQIHSHALRKLKLLGKEMVLAA
ncbi:MAG: sigma-70 family RNA polymerase sigma factor [bacterium]